MMKTNMGLENFRFSYVNDFDDETIDDEEYPEFEATKEYLEVIREDLKRLVSYVECMDTIYKKSFITLANNVINSILLDESKRPRKYEKQKEWLDIKVDDNYVMFSVFDSYFYQYVEKAHKPIRVIMSRRVNGMEIYFIEEAKQEKVYELDAMNITRFVINKDNIVMDSKNISDYSFIDEMAMEKTQECVLQLERRIK